MTNLPRLGVDLRHPDEHDKASKADMSQWEREPDPKCGVCMGTGHVYGERGLFKRCACRIPIDAPENVGRWLVKELYELF